MAEKDAYRTDDSAGVPVYATTAGRLPVAPVIAQPAAVAGPAGQAYAYPPPQPHQAYGYPPQQQASQYGYPQPQQATYAIQQPQQHLPDLIPNRPPPRGFWGSNICDWPLNLFPSCYCACCCLHGCWIVGQMAEKTGFALFRTISLGYVLMWIITLAISLTSFENRYTVAWLPCLFMMCVNIGLRLHIVRTRQITECGSPADGCGNLVGELCCGLWCLPCAVAQQARFLYGYTKAFDGDSRVDRPDQYTEVQQV